MIYRKVHLFEKQMRQSRSLRNSLAGWIGEREGSNLPGRDRPADDGEKSFLCRLVLAAAYGHLLPVFQQKAVFCDPGHKL